MSLNQGFQTAGNASAPSLHVVMSGGGSEFEFLRGVIKEISVYPITGMSGTSAGAIAAALYVSGYNTNGRAEGLRRLTNFSNDLRLSGWHYLLARANLAFIGYSGEGRSRLWTKTLGLTHDFMRTMGVESPMKTAIETLLRKHIPDIDKLNHGPMTIAVNTITIDPKTGTTNHHIHQSGSITFETIIASASLEKMGGTLVNGVMNYDGGHDYNGFPEAALNDEDATDIMWVSTYALDHAEQSNPINGLGIKQGQLHSDMLRLYMDDSNPKFLHVIAPDVSQDDIARMSNDPLHLMKRNSAGTVSTQQWIRDHAHKLGRSDSCVFPAVVMDRVFNAGLKQLAA
jgi:predicted acylesterase/phospholipase RssA